MILLVYAIVPLQVSHIAQTGLAGERLHRVAAGRVAAIVGRLRQPPQPTMKAMRRYAAVVDRLALGAPAIIPARFGTAMMDRDELTAALVHRNDALRRRLAAVRGRVQMTLRVKPASGHEPVDGKHASNVRKAPATRMPRRLGEGARHLQRRAAAADAARQIPGFEPFRAATGRWVRDERIERRDETATVYHLIPRSSADAYLKAIERVARGHTDVSVRVTGPYPPYAFAESW